MKRCVLLVFGCLLLTACAVNFVQVDGPFPAVSIAPAARSVPSVLTDTMAMTLTLTSTLTSTSTPPVSVTLPAPTRTATPAPTAPPPTPTPAPRIVYFTAWPEAVWPGEPVTLAWQGVGERASITPLNASGQMTGETISVPLVGSIEMTPAPGHYNRIGYLLTVSQGSAYKTAGVWVQLFCAHEWFFAPPPDVCPLEPALVSQAAEQHFERGVMIWIQELDQIFVLYGGHYADPYNRSWAVFPDEWDEGEPDRDPSLTVPSGLHQPVRGFGLVWRERPGVREQLGYAIDEETGFETALQRTSWSKYNSIYVRALDGDVWRLGPEHSSWEKVPATPNGAR